MECKFLAWAGRPQPLPPNRLRASRQIHSPSGRRKRLMVRSQLMKRYLLKSNDALIPLPESAATATR